MPAKQKNKAAKPPGRKARRNVMFSQVTIERLEAIRRTNELDSFSDAVAWAVRVATEKGGN
jgi:hypothetical protein